MHLELAPTGLFAGGGARSMDAQFAAYAWSNDQRIKKLTGQPFTQAYRDRILGAAGGRSVDGPRQILTRGAPWLCESAQRATRLPAGHPEAFIEAFANLYLGVAADIRAHAAGQTPDLLAADYPRVEAGARGVRFIEKVVESGASERKWTALD